MTEKLQKGGNRARGATRSRGARRRPSALAGTAVLAMAALAALAATTGCRDDLMSPTQGFIELFTGDVTPDTIYVDGEPAAMGGNLVGPIEAGTYQVSVVREFFEVVSPGTLQVTVRPAETARALFELEPTVFGAAHVHAIDEITQLDVAGRIWLQKNQGPLEDTGLMTPATVDSLPGGTATIVVRLADRDDATTVVTIDTEDLLEVAAVMSPPAAVLAEMFTFRSCQGCPPAAEELKHQYDARPGTAYVIEWHIAEAYQDVRWIERRTFYADLSGVPMNGFPAVLFQGELPWLEGGDIGQTGQYASAMDDAVAPCPDACPLALSTEGDVIGDANHGEATVTARMRWRAGTPPADLELRIVLLAHGITVIGPYGVDIDFDFMALDMVEVTDIVWSGPDSDYFEFTTGGAEPNVLERTPPDNPLWPDIDHWTYVAYVQSRSTGEVFAVSGSR